MDAWGGYEGTQEGVGEGKGRSYSERPYIEWKISHQKKAIRFRIAFFK